MFKHSGAVKSAWFAAFPFLCEEHYCGYVAAFVFLQVAGAVAAEFARVVLCHDVRAMVTNNVVDAYG